MMGLFKKIGNAFKKAAKAVVNIAKKAVDVVKQGINVIKAAAKMALTPAMMMGALLTGKGIDGARDVFVKSASEFGKELNKLVDSAIVLAVAAMDATPMGAALNQIPGYQTVKAIVVEVVSSTLKSVGNVMNSVAAVAAAVGETSFKNVMSKMGELALNVLDVAANFVPAGKAALVIGRMATVVDTAMTVKTLSTEDGREAFKQGMQSIKNNPEAAAALVVGFAAAGSRGSGGPDMPPVAGKRAGTAAKTPDMPSSKSADGAGSGGKAKGADDTKDTKKSDDDNEIADNVEEATDVGSEAVHTAMANGDSSANGSDQNTSMAQQYPQYSVFNVLRPYDLVSMLLLTGSGAADNHNGKSGEQKKPVEPNNRHAVAA